MGSVSRKLAQAKDIFERSKNLPTTFDHLNTICSSLQVTGHLAIMSSGYIEKILSGKKTMESRFGKTKAAPYMRIARGDIIFLKESGGPIRAIAWVSEALCYGPMIGNAAEELMMKFRNELSLQSIFIERKKESRFATLIRIGHALSVKETEFLKTDRRPWVVLCKEYLKERSYHTQLPLIEQSTNCSQGFHTYHRSKRTNQNGNSICSACGADVIDWNRLHMRKRSDVQYLIRQLKTDEFRMDWWKRQIDRHATNHALRKGRRLLREAISKRIRQSIGVVYKMKDGSLKPYRDGYQTPFTGNAIYYAQHALACCCRECLAIWHGIPEGRNLKTDELTYLCFLVETYIRIRIPNLQDTGVHIPPIRRSRDPE